ncbi:MAG: TauD/TfdA family dioxygenase [Scytonema sp. PMC 1070.18]|nr:TauD/TfdA family dioxygenase [Scytonema sp. PMC 1070.18]
MLVNNNHTNKKNVSALSLNALKPIDVVKIDMNWVTLKISEVAKIKDTELQRLFDIFNKFKFVIIECESSPNPRENLLALRRFFGSVKRHKRSDQDGIVPVQNFGNTLATSDQISATNKQHLLHTDGSFDLDPPKVVAMQCEIPAETGGFSQIVYGEAIYEYLNKNYLEELQNLFSNPITITRGRETATRAMFVSKEGRVLITFRYDSVISITIPKEVKTAVEIVKDYILNPNNQFIYKLKFHQILVIDNTSLLHGRTSFPNNEFRKINRLWFDGISEYFNSLQFGFTPKSQLNGKTLIMN